MKTRSNLVGVASSVMVLLLAYAVDLGLNALREYSGRSFDFRTAIAGQLGLVLLFGLLLVAFQTVLVHLRPDRWLFWVCIGLGAIVFVPFCRLPLCGHSRHSQLVEYCAALAVHVHRCRCRAVDRRQPSVPPRPGLTSRLHQPDSQYQ